MNLKNLRFDKMSKQQRENFFRFEVCVASLGRFINRHLERDINKEKQKILLLSQQKLQILVSNIGTNVRTVTEGDSLDAYLVIDFKRDLDVVGRGKLAEFQTFFDDFVSFNVVPLSHKLYRDVFEESEEGQKYRGRIEWTLPDFFEPINLDDKQEYTLEDLPNFENRMFEENYADANIAQILQELMQTEDSNGSTEWCPDFDPTQSEEINPLLFISGQPYSRKIFMDHLSDALLEESDPEKFWNTPINKWLKEHNFGNIKLI